MKGQGSRGRFGRKSSPEPLGLREIIRKLMSAKLSKVTADDDAALAAIRDEAALAQLVGALASASGAREIRAALAAARARAESAGASAGDEAPATEATATVPPAVDEP